MYFAKTKKSDFFSFSEERTRFVEAELNGLITCREREEALGVLMRSYSGRLFPRDHYEFRDPDIFAMFTRSVFANEDPTKLTDIIEHEKAHADKIRELGRRAIYCCVLLVDDTDPNYDPTTLFLPGTMATYVCADREMTVEENLQVLRAPEKPSGFDEQAYRNLSTS